MNWMLARSCNTMDFGEMKPAIEHERGGIRCFSRVQFGESVIICYYFGTLMYAILYRNKDCDKRYGEW